MTDVPVPVNPLRIKLSRRELATSMILRMARGPEIAGIAQAAGLDAAYIDMEHGSLSLDMAAGLCLWLRQAGVAPLIRVPSGDASTLARALDAGAFGVIVPHVETEAQARSVTRAVRFPPEGTRSWSSGQPLLGYGPMPAHVGQAVLNREILVVLMVESRSALDQIESIASVDGVDLLLLGVGDLLTEMGVPGQLRHPDLERSIDRVIAAGRSHDVPVGLGGMAQDPEAMQAWVRRGIGFLSLGTDAALLVAGAKNAVQAVTGQPQEPGVRESNAPGKS
ncbi:MAG: aldolase/citrate lyase family protein [Burkholderiaceae bacterium]